MMLPRSSRLLTGLRVPAQWEQRLLECLDLPTQKPRRSLTPVRGARVFTTTRFAMFVVLLVAS